MNQCCQVLTAESWEWDHADLIKLRVQEWPGCVWGQGPNLDVITGVLLERAAGLDCAEEKISLGQREAKDARLGRMW